MQLIAILLISIIITFLVMNVLYSDYCFIIINCNHLFKFRIILIDVKLSYFMNGLYIVYLIHI